MIDSRISGLRDRMAANDIDLAIFGCGPGYQYLTGEINGWRFRSDTVSDDEILLVPATGPVLSPNNADGNLIDTVRDIARDPAFRRIALGDRLAPTVWVAIINAFPAAEIIAGDTLLASMRLMKDDAEVAILKKAAAITDKAVMSAVSSIKEGITMRELQLEIEYKARMFGATGTSFDIVSGFIREGTHATGSIFSYGLDEGLRTDTTIFFDIGFVVDGYCSDWGRSLHFGSPDPDIRTAYAALQDAVVESAAAIVPGETRVNDIYPAIEASLDESGYGDFLRARLPGKSVGHQIGIEVHEIPWLEPQNDDVLRPGMVMCFEPKLWDDGRYYMRVEDMVLVTDHGAELLTTFDRDLFVL